MRPRYYRRGVLILLLIVSSPVFALDLLFFGDVMVGRRLEPFITEHGVDALFDGVRTLRDGSALRDLDLVSANLEGAITVDAELAPPVYPYDFAFAPERIALLRDNGISFFTIANNHLYDQGPAGVASTRRFLDQLGIGFSGDVDRVVSPHSVTIIERRGVRLGMVGLSEVYNPLKRDEVRALLVELEARVDVTIVNIHWGVEYEYEPRSHQRDMAIILEQSGADLIIGHHPHVTQGIELINDTPVFYSLGNFLFDQAFSREVQEGYAVRVGIDGTESGAVVRTIRLEPYRAVDSVPRWHVGDTRVERLTILADRSFGPDTLKAAVRSGTIRVVRRE